MRRRTAVKPAQEQAPVPRPSPEALGAAFEVVDAFRLHFHQLLFFKKLTEPGNGHPFNLKWSVQHSHCIQVEVSPWSGRRFEFDFLITPDMTDETVLSHCSLILDAINSGKKMVDCMACCPLAKYTPCVCAHSFECPIHGAKHVGTHD